MAVVVAVMAVFLRWYAVVLLALWLPWEISRFVRSRSS
jgi:hypothetical protein